MAFAPSSKDAAVGLIDVMAIRARCKETHVGHRRQQDLSARRPMAAMTPPRRLPGWRKARWSAAVLVTVLVGVAVIGEALEWRFLKSPLQAALQRATGLSARIDGDFRARLLRGPMVSVEHLTVPSTQFPGLPYLADATGLRLQWRWLDVWRAAWGGPVRVHSLELTRLDAQLIRDADGHTSWQRPGRQPAGRLPRFGLLSIQQGHIRWTDAPLATHIDLVVQGADGSRRSGYDIKASGLVRSLPLDLDIRVGGMLALLNDEAGDAAAAAVPLRIEGKAGRSTVFFDGTATAPFDAQRLAGEFKFSGPSLAAVGTPLGMVLPRTPAFDLAGRIAHDAGVWTLASEHLRIGQSHLAGDFRYDTREPPGKLTGQLRGRLLQLADLGPAVGTAGEGGSSGVLQGAARQRVLPTRGFDLPSLRAMNADMAVAIETLDLGSQDIAPMRRLRTHLTLQDGRLKLADLQAEVAGGRMSGTTELDGTADVAKWKADLRFDGIDIAKWLRRLQKGADGSATAYLTGEMVARLQATGSGRSTAAILGSLNGQALARLRNGTMSHLAVEAAGLDLAQALGVMVRGDRSLTLRCAVVAMALHDGVATVKRAVVDTSDSSLNVLGSLSLKDEALNLRVVAKPKDFSPLSLRAPVTVTGSLAEPVVGIEAQGLAGRAVAAAALALLAPPAALLAFMDFGDAATADPCLAGAPPNAEAPAGRKAKRVGLP
jgi:AsmA family protein